MKTVFLSSTSKDLEAYRDAAIKVCMKLNLHPIAMEYFNAMPAGATAGSKHKLDEADFYVGFFAHRYGYIEDAADGRSVTEIEFDYAGERGLDRICFIVDPAFDWPPAYTDHDNYPKLETFKSKVNRLIRGQFTSVDNFASQLTTALVEWQGAQQARAGSTSAVHVTRPDKLREKPKILFGRDALLTDVRALLEKHEQVLLQGFGGMGKTALAATIADQWIADNKGTVLWLKTGSADVDALFEALARPFDAQQAVASQTGDAKIDKVYDLLYESHATLLVLDDCWSSKDLFALLKVVPADMAVLATARQRYPLSKIRPVDELAPADALALLAYHADRDFKHAQPVGTRHAVSAGENDTSAATLCDLLGHHAFAVEIAGKTLKTQEWTPAELLKQIKNAPDKLTMPLEFSETGRENVAKLLEVSLHALDKETRSLFLAFGAFFAPHITAEMLQLYFDGVSDSPRPQGEGQGVRVDAALNVLHLQGLVERLPATDESVTAYRVHDLAYSYARAQSSDDQHQLALQACLAYTERYNQPSLPNFAALRPELDNLLGAASWAFENAQYATVEQFAWNLYVHSQFMGYRGFYSEATRLFTQAIEAARRSGNEYNQAAHLMCLGLAYSNLGQVEQAIHSYQQALALQHEIGDKNNEGKNLGNLGNAYFTLGQVKQAIEYHKQALTISREIGDKGGEGADLGGLGNAYFTLGQVKQAIEYYEQALTISREIGDKRNEGNWLSGLGIAYSDLRQTEQAMQYYQQAITIRRAIGDRMGEANDLNNMGAIYDDQTDYTSALHYYQQARAIYAAIGAQDRLTRTDKRIARVQAKLAGDGGTSS